MTTKNTLVANYFWHLIKPRIKLF